MNRDSPLATALAPSPNHGGRRGKIVDSIILHYTGMASGAAALTRLRDPASSVSCHYLVWEDGQVSQLVAESERAWHAGASYWAGETDLNSVSIGIEIVNSGHDGGCPPYPAVQISSVIALCEDIRARHAIPPARILAHSDIAPSRKIDPGEWFPWEQFAAAGLGLWVAPTPIADGPVMRRGDESADVLGLQQGLAAIGYGVPISGAFCEATSQAVAGFQRHWRPALIDGVADMSTAATLKALRQGLEQAE